MCGRFMLRASPAEIAEFFELMRELFDWSQPRFNIAPTQTVLAVQQVAKSHEPVWFRWGLIPPWAQDASFGAKCINARAEGLSESRVFKTPFQRYRCLIVADGFYEWERIGKTKKSPIQFTLRDTDLFAFAGLAERWRSPTGEIVESCSIITTSANELLAPIHDRMPVILHSSDYDRWLDPQNHEIDSLQPLLVPYPAEEMRAERVSEVINNVRNNVDPRMPSSPTSAPTSAKKQASLLFDDGD